MKFGRFDDDAREYVIETPRTPQPWINYLGYLGFFSIISNTGGGYSFYRDARLRRITRYRYNNIPADMGGRYFYVHDNGDIWNPGWMPVRRDLDRYECRHGLGYTVISGERNSIAVTTTHFVPLHDECEITRLTVRNTGSAAKSIVLFSFAEFCLWNALDDMTNFQRNLSIGEVEVEGSAIYHKTEYRERRDHFAFYSVNCPIDGFDTDRDTFLGPCNGLDNPDVVRRGAPGNSMADGWAPIASHAVRVTLKPGEQRPYVFILGYVENPQAEKFVRPKVINKARAKAMMERYATDSAVVKALDELKAFWQKALANYHVESPDPILNRVVNTWNPYQSLVTFNMARSASAFESGISRGIGFRDTLQDLLGMLHQFPERCRERLIECAAVQFPDGSCYHQYQPLTKEGNNDLGSNFNDDPMWFVFAVAKYLMETGDLGLLDEKVPFAGEGAKPATIFEHLRAAFHYVAEHTGPHGLPLIGRADWNDCLNLNCFSETPDESFQTVKNKEGTVAESVMIGQMFVFFGKEYAAICALTGREDESAKARALIATMEKAVLEHGWDGEWFLRAYDDSGAKLGSKTCAEGRIFIETQAMGAMGEIGKDRGHTAKVLDAVDRHLNTEHGAVLVQPAFSEYRLSMGEITSYPEGYKENASIFCHTNIWMVIAECLFGRGDKAYEYYRKFTSPFKEGMSEVHRCEPYVYAEFIAGRDAKRFGQAKNSWLTGTASYCFLGVSQYILGIRPDYDGLVVDPCIPSSWTGFTVNRLFRGAEYRITVRNPGKVSRGIKAITLNGRALQGNKLPVQAKGTVCTIDVLMG